MRRLLFGLALLPFSCRKSPPPDPGGTLTVTWAGASKGRFAAAATGAWCARDSLVEILAVAGDTGFGFTLITPGTVKTGQYPVLAAAVGADWRPMGLVSLRLASDTALKGYEGNSGQLEVTQGSATLVSGTISVRLKQTDANDTLRLTGSFDRIAIAPAQGGCGRMPKQQPTAASPAAPQPGIAPPATTR